MPLECASIGRSFASLSGRFGIRPRLDVGRLDAESGHDGADLRTSLDCPRPRWTRSGPKERQSSRGPEAGDTPGGSRDRASLSLNRLREKSALGPVHRLRSPDGCDGNGE